MNLDGVSKLDDEQKLELKEEGRKKEREFVLRFDYSCSYCHALKLNED